MEEEKLEVAKQLISTSRSLEGRGKNTSKETQNNTLKLRKRHSLKTVMAK